MILLSVASIRKYLWFSVRNHFHKVRIVRLIYPIFLSAIVGYDLSNCWYGGKASTAWTAYVNSSQEKVVWLHSGNRTWIGGVLFVNNISRVWEAFISGTAKRTWILILYLICKLKKKMSKLVLKQNVTVAAFSNKETGKNLQLEMKFLRNTKAAIFAQAK